jgi:integrase
MDSRKKKTCRLTAEVITVRLDSGEDVSYLVNRKNWQTLQLTVLYALERRLTSQSATIKNTAQSLAYLYSCAIETDFPLDDYLSGRRAYDSSAFEHFVRRLFIYMQTGSADSKIAGVIKSRLAPDSFVVYWNNIYFFIRHWLERLFKNRRGELNETDMKRLSFSLKSVGDRFTEFASLPSRRQTLRVLTEKELLTVIEAFHPDSKLFREDVVKWRNWAIFLLLLDSGMRRGELLSFRLTGLPANPTSYRIIIRREPDALDDPRRYRPSVKSRSRELNILGRTIKYINRYVGFHRSDHGRSLFLFLNETSEKPLSISTLNSMFMKVSKATGIEVSPHTLRHTRHYYRLRELAKSNDDLEYAKEIVVREGGWSPVRGIPDTYTRQYFIDESNESAPLFLDEIISKIKPPSEC